MPIIRAAGGLVWREDGGGRRRLAVVHRPHRKDWSLPKGKLEDGERWEDAAVREVREETGCDARIVSFAGVVHYVPDRTPKVVLFWNMELVSKGPLHFPEEVDEIAWLTAPEALRRLDHDTERDSCSRRSSCVSSSPGPRRSPHRARGRGGGCWPRGSQPPERSPSRASSRPGSVRPAPSPSRLAPLRSASSPPWVRPPGSAPSGDPAAPPGRPPPC